MTNDESFNDALTESWRDGALGDGAVTGAVPDPYLPLRARGISPEVQEARGYVPYYGRKHPLYDPAAFKAELAGYEMTAGQRSTYSRFASSARTRDADTRDKDGYGVGLLMRKWQFPTLPAILPQLRPDEAVRTGSKTRHRHDRAFSDPRELARHLAEEHPGEDIAADELHEHENLAKYTLASRAREDYTHDHATDPLFQGPKGTQKLAQHLRKHHGKRTRYKGENVAGPHTHRRFVAGQHVADRLDIHPWARERLLTSDRIYLVLEGTPKADSILTRILATGAAASVLDVPSVTLWAAPELDYVARLWLQGLSTRDVKPLVVIVYDADGSDNPRVVRQALLCREYLRERGVSCCAAAPPWQDGLNKCPCSQPRVDHSGFCANCGGYLKGVDDFLAAGGELDQLLVLDRDAPFTLALHANEDGTIRSTIPGLWPLLRCRRTAERAVELLQNYVDHGLLQVDRKLELAVDEWTGCRGWKGERAEWPTFTVRPDQRYTQRFVPLSDYDPPRTLDRVGRVLQNMQEAHDADRSTSMFPSHKHFAEAIIATAGQEGVTPGTIRDDPGVRGARAGWEYVFALFVHVARQGEPPMSDARVAEMWGVSAKKVRRVAQQPLPAKFDETLKEPRMEIAPLPTDDHLIADAVRLGNLGNELVGIGHEIIDTAGRLQQRYPTEATVKDAVDQLIASTRGTESGSGTDGR